VDLFEVIERRQSFGRSRQLRSALRSSGASLPPCEAPSAGNVQSFRVVVVADHSNRLELAKAAYGQAVRPATLLIVGGADYGVIELNQNAFLVLTCEKRLEIVPGATHLFEEPGTLDKVVDPAAQWFSAHFEVAKT
jgi:hypothetical protein